MSERRARAALAVLVGIYVLYFSAFTCLFHMTFNTFAYDLGTVDQGVWLAGHSRDLFVTVRGLHLLGDHVRPIAFVLAPLYWVWDDVRMLLIAQTVAIAAGAVFVYLLARRELGNRYALALALAASYLLNPAVQNLNLDHVHPDAFAQTSILGSLYFLRVSRLVPFWITVALAMMCKEDVPIVYMAIGVILILSGRRVLGVCLMAVAAAYFLVCMKVILPYFNKVGVFRLQRGYFVNIKNNLLDPSWFFRRLTSPEVLRYFLALGLPLAFLSLVAPMWMLPSLPSLLANIFSDVRYMRTVEFHYATSIVPFLYLTAIHGAASLSSSQRLGRSTDRNLALVIAGGAVAANLAFSVAPLSHAGRLYGFWRIWHSDPVHTIASALERIPKDAVVSADYSLVPHLTHRQRVYMFPNPFRTENWAFSNREPHDAAEIQFLIVRNTVIREKGQHIIDSLVDAGLFISEMREKEVSLYRRVATLEVAKGATCGDWNGDGQVGEIDAKRIGAAITQKRPCPAYVCDADGDGENTVKDALLLTRLSVGERETLSCPARPQR